MSPRLAFAIMAAHRAGRRTLSYFQTGEAVDLKEDLSPVTRADREAEALIREMIGERFPDDAILGEEEGLSGTGAARWVIDPIDGTKSFVSGVPLYATLLSYEVDERPELGVCYLPALDEIIYAERGQGCYWNGRPCRVSDRDTLENAVMCCGSIVRMTDLGWMPGLLRLAEGAMALRTWSDAYGHALVATGRVDAMFDPVVSRWDLSAMAVIVEEAGGRFSDFSGRDGVFEEAISSNGLLHQRLLDGIRS